MELNFLVTIISFVFGSSIGSFISVIINRHKHQEKGTINGRSMCPKCRHQLHSIDLIPLFSFIFNHGKCRYCKKPISKHYFYIELVTGFIFALWAQIIPFYANTNLTPKLQFLFSIATSAILMAIFFYDYLYQEIPDSFSISGIVLGIIAAIIFHQPSASSIGIGLLIILTFFGGQILISKGKWLGTGDLVLGVFMAIILGWQQLVLALGLAYIIGATVAVTLLLTNKVSRKTNIPFAPFLITGTFISLMFGNIIISWYLNFVII